LENQSPQALSLARSRDVAAEHADLVAVSATERFNESAGAGSSEGAPSPLPPVYPEGPILCPDAQHGSNAHSTWNRATRGSAGGEGRRLFRSTILARGAVRRICPLWPSSRIPWTRFGFSGGTGERARKPRRHL
jgi:hypothetical protein